MSSINIAAIDGSLHRESVTRQPATTTAALAPVDFSVKPLEIADLPLCNQDNGAPPSAGLVRLQADTAASLGLLLVTSASKRSIPGVLQNAQGLACRPCGHSA